MCADLFYLQVKVVELSDALESTGSYSKAEITQRVEKYRDKLMNVSSQILVPIVNHMISHRRRSNPKSLHPLHPGGGRRHGPLPHLF